MKPLDNFSKQSATYKKYRPVYPTALYDEILTHVRVKNVAWDCATGNGQVAAAIAPYFKKVLASDLSAHQIAHAPKVDHVDYSVQPSEHTTYPAQVFDLITVAQAAHWLDLEAFHEEVIRVGRPGAVIAIWGYGLLCISQEVDRVIDHFYKDVIGSYWDPQRKHIDDAYTNVSFPYEMIPVTKSYHIETQWSLGQLIGYLNSWSSVQHYIKEHRKSPITIIEHELRAAWGDEQGKEVLFPIFIKLGRL